jgi:DNA replication protein DnaC
LPPRFQNADFDNFIAAGPQQQNALDSARQYALEFAGNLARGRCLIFTGRVGTGKTHLACAIVRELLRRRYRALILSAYDCVQQVKDSWSRGSAEKEAAVLERLLQPDLLVIDELGAQFGSAAEKLILFNIINRRYENIKPLLLVSNEDRSGLEALLGERTFDRLKQGGGVLAPFNWNSARQ